MERSKRSRESRWWDWHRVRPARHTPTHGWTGGGVEPGSAMRTVSVYRPGSPFENRHMAASVAIFDAICTASVTGRARIDPVRLHGGCVHRCVAATDPFWAGVVLSVPVRSAVRNTAEPWIWLGPSEVARPGVRNAEWGDAPDGVGSIFSINHARHPCAATLPPTHADQISAGQEDQEGRRIGR